MEAAESKVTDSAFVRVRQWRFRAEDVETEEEA